MSVTNGWDTHTTQVDLNLIPIIAILYLCSFVAGMANDLELTGLRYQLAAAVNVIMKLMQPSNWISGIMLAWGIVSNARVFLGLAEAGLPPGVAFLITIWYRREDQARPLSLYFSTATLSGAFGGLLAFAIEKMDGLGNLRGWAWIFLLEGLVTIVASLLAFWKLPDYPSTAKFLTPKVLRRDNEGEPSHFEMRFVWETVRDYKSWLQTIIYIGMVMPLYSISIFLPTIINALGYTASQAQLYVFPSSIVMFLSTDAFYPSGQTYRGVVYAGCILITCGVFPTVPLMLIWGSGNSGSSLKKGVIIGLQSGDCSSFIYRTQDTPRFHMGHGIVLGFLCMAFVTSAFTICLYYRLNQAKEVLCAKEGIQGDRKAEFANLGVDSPLFR
ncbi:MFS general substrate transporter [Desarmillaria tabescens]|uniref:MFS general substrate transporter n=1 Tax=Armillaria tabescens TaxID=1929756 RepID=A0AA39N0C9_ARMTA|nr:MFS general substrate transporter [Desarmillaria tabescens]KAK0452749.1 MFS general substrate transporter [Desarmillaria tabescens]